MTRYTYRKLTADARAFSRYRKPANANGSTARYFFRHLTTKH